VVANRHLGKLDLKAAYADRRSVADAVLRVASGGSAAANATLQADLGLRALRTGPKMGQARLDSRLKIDTLDLSVLSTFSDELKRVEGIVTADVGIKGPLAELRPEGTLQLKGGRASILGYGSYRDVALDLVVSDRTLQVKELYARAGAGWLKLNGVAERESTSAPFHLKAWLRSEKLPVVVNDKLLALLSTETERLTGELQWPRMALDVGLAKTVVGLPELGGKDVQTLDPHPDIRIVTEKDPPPASGGSGLQKVSVTKPAEGGLDLRLKLAAPRDLRVESKDVRIDATADLTLVAANGKTTLTGDIRTSEGMVDVMGRRFQVARGAVTYAGDPPGEPRLDVLAVHENQREQVKVTVTITGSAKKPRIDLGSEPALDETQIASLLATGRKELKRGSGGVASTGGAGSVLTNFVADRLRKTIASKLPIDVLQVELGDQGELSQVEAGVYITDDLYLGYRNKTDKYKVRQNEVSIEYEVMDGVTVESKGGDGHGGNIGADIVFTKEY